MWHPKYKTVGLVSYLGSQSICFMGFWISYYGWFYARCALIHFLFLTPFTLPPRITMFAFSKCSLCFPCILFQSPLFQPPFPPSHLLFIAQYEWMRYDYFR